jgi:hypothetical protein
LYYCPKTQRVDDFIKFIQEELVSRQVNTLLLRVDYNYQFESHPELRDPEALSKKDIKKWSAFVRKTIFDLFPRLIYWGTNHGRALRTIY